MQAMKLTVLKKSHKLRIIIAWDPACSNPLSNFPAWQCVRSNVHIGPSACRLARLARSLAPGGFLFSFAWKIVFPGVGGAAGRPAIAKRRSNGGGKRRGRLAPLSVRIVTHTKVYDGNRLAVIASQYHYWIVISTHIVKEDNDNEYCMMYILTTLPWCLFSYFVPLPLRIYEAKLYFSRQLNFLLL